MWFQIHPYLGKIPILTNIFQRGWFNHQPVLFVLFFRMHSYDVPKKWSPEARPAFRESVNTSLKATKGFGTEDFVRKLHESGGFQIFQVVP